MDNADKGLHIPVAWNSSGYETVETVRTVSEFVDIWLPDFKAADSVTAGKYFGLPGYADAAKKAILAMADLSKIELDGRGGLTPGTYCTASGAAGRNGIDTDCSGMVCR